MATTTPRLRSGLAIVAETIDRHDLIMAGEKVLVALSGGADSCALSVILGALNYDLVLAHVDHGMRPDSSMDAIRCGEIAARLRLPFLSRNVKVDPPTEVTARDRRYEALQAMAVHVGASKIATGHTLDDQAETVLMRLGRGGRPIGIPYRRGNIARPILDLRRTDTIAIAQAEGIEFINDPTNLDIRITRNLIRLSVLPRFSDDVVVHLAEAARSASRLSQELSDVVEELALLHVRETNGRIEIDRSALITSDPKVGRALLRTVIARSGLDVSERFVSDFIGRVINSTGASLDLPEGWAASVEAEQVVISKRVRNAAREPVLLEIPGVTPLRAWGFTAHADLLDAVPSTNSRSPFEAYFDYGRILNRDLIVRQRRAGDRFHPFGLAGTKKLQDFFVDAKVPRAERDRVPIVVSDNEIMWVVGHRIDKRVGTHERTTRVLRLRFATTRERP